MPRPSFEEYVDWIYRTHGVVHDAATERRYKINVQAVVNTVQVHAFTAGLSDRLRSLSGRWTAERGGELLMDGGAELRFLTKSYASALDKSFRHNVAWNSDFPNPPKGSEPASTPEWLAPHRWFQQFNDTVRATIVTKYLDGPEWLFNRLKEYAQECGLQSTGYSQQKDVGYYAYHFYATFRVELTDAEWAAMPQDVRVEIQITTQLQDILRSLTHPFYSAERTAVESPNSEMAWQWQHKTPRFRARYLSHTLHLLESLVVDLREAAHAELHKPAEPVEAREEVTVEVNADAARPAHPEALVQTAEEAPHPEVNDA